MVFDRYILLDAGFFNADDQRKNQLNQGSFFASLEAFESYENMMSPEIVFLKIVAVG